MALRARPTAPGTPLSYVGLAPGFAFRLGNKFDHRRSFFARRICYRGGAKPGRGSETRTRTVLRSRGRNRGRALHELSARDRTQAGLPYAAVPPGERWERNRDADSFAFEGEGGAKPGRGSETGTRTVLRSGSETGTRTVLRSRGRNRGRALHELSARGSDPGWLTLRGRPSGRTVCSNPSIYRSPHPLVTAVGSSSLDAQAHSV